VCAYTFCHRSSDQDCLEIAPNDADGLVTSRRYLVYNSWYRKWGDYLDLVPVSASLSKTRTVLLRTMETKFISTIDGAKFSR
jgi:hypothetical protein